ncbi:MAG: sugar phosphate isomerase/epimerase family protein [Acidobacteriota bacterium]
MHTALFSVSFAGLWGQERLTLEQSIDLAADLGYEGIEIMGKRPHLSILDYSLDDCRRLRDQVERRGLRVAAVAAYTDFTAGASAGEVPLGEMQVAYIGELARRAALLDCDLLRVFTAYEHDGASFMAQWRQTVDALLASGDLAADAGVQIGVQNHHDLAVDTKALIELLAQVDRPNISPMFDCWSAHLRGEDVAAGAARLAAQMRFTTVADYVVLPRWKYQPHLVNYAAAQPPAVFAVPIGEGDLPYEAFLGALQSNGFEGWVSYEMCSPLRGGGSLDTLKQYARGFLEYMIRFAGVTRGPIPDHQERVP